MKKCFLLLLITVGFFNGKLQAQHNLSECSTCRFMIKKTTCTNKITCPECDKIKTLEIAARQAEDKKITTKNIVKTDASVGINKYGALAIDRTNGYYYGWSYDYTTLAEAEQKAVDECTKKGGNCSVVLTYSGTGCAAYRTIDGSVGTAFGWGLGKTKEEADAIAMKECLKRSNSATPTNFVWSCNSANSSALKEIYNASQEIETSVRVGDQIWSGRNLDVSTFRNGDPIPEAKNAAEWKEFCKADKPAFVYLNFDPANGKKYGKLYNFHAVVDPRGLPPVGWHVPSKEEFETLISFLGGESEAGKKMRSTTGWDIPRKVNGIYPGNGTNSSGLNLLPGLYANENQYDPDPEAKPAYVFEQYYGDGNWWTSSVKNARWNENNGYGYYNNAYYLKFSNYTTHLTYIFEQPPQIGCSVRVIKD